jgi:hypothetical protein
LTPVIVNNASVDLEETQLLLQSNGNYIGLKQKDIQILAEEFFR